ncbi:BgTH12-06322 [Blumeria graminis f. sp. triticale]|uniref:BgtAc-30333 n=2 Tax=Blumeria graminis TaxID=34373 RepID=A0A9X9PSB5_BLUGR|nr:BgTH12-06322 [Blumeria graminis f. sp. triticale]VCU40886.1 BgtAc-30333 [Blumeria graminis f. sp. tritici]
MAITTSHSKTSRNNPRYSSGRRLSKTALITKTIPLGESGPRADDVNASRPMSSWQPYRDTPLRETGTTIKDPIQDTANPPPDYEPMHDYLRNRSVSPVCTSPLPPYSDEPYLIHIPDADAPSAPFTESIRPHEFEMRTLWRAIESEAEAAAYDAEEENESAQTIEDLVKWIVLMFLISLIIAFFGTVFDWGRPRQCGMRGPC